MNKNVLIIGVVVVLLAGAGFMFMQSQSGTGTNDAVMEKNEDEAMEKTTEVVGQNAVEIKDFKYSPATLTVKVGDTVTWTNKDLAGHSATADDGSFDTGVLSQGKSGSFTFTKAGTFAYHCLPHPNIKGTIVVE